jgi:hypothetical protein
MQFREKTFRKPGDCLSSINLRCASKMVMAMGHFDVCPLRQLAYGISIERSVEPPNWSALTNERESWSKYWNLSLQSDCHQIFITKLEMLTIFQFRESKGIKCWLFYFLRANGSNVDHFSLLRTNKRNIDHFSLFHDNMDSSLGLREPNIVHRTSPSDDPELFPRGIMLSDKWSGSSALREKFGITEGESINLTDCVLCHWSMLRYGPCKIEKDKLSGSWITEGQHRKIFNSSDL